MIDSLMSRMGMAQKLSVAQLKQSVKDFEGVRIKGSNSNAVTNVAKLVQKLRTRLTLAENHVIDRGPLDLYIRVIGPDGAVISSLKGSFLSNGKPLAYTLKETVNYANTDTPVEISWASGSQFTAGGYSVEVYQSGVLISTSSVTLK